MEISKRGTNLMSSVIVKFMWVVHNGHMEECTDMKEHSVDRGQGI